MKTLFILLPVHSRREITRKIVLCLQQQTFQNFHLVLIDDGSTDGTAEMVKEYIPSLTILTGTGDWWWGGSLHQGYLWLKSQKLPPSAMALIMNDDAVFAPNYLQTGIDALSALRRTLLVSVAYGQGHHQQIDGGVFADWKHWKFPLEPNPAKVNCASTRGLFLFVSDFMEIGGFYPKLLPHYTSDYEFTTRAYRKGFTLLPDERLQLLSDEKASGIYNFKDVQTYSEFLKKLFSKKYTLQPVYNTNFVALASPWPWKLTNWIHIWSSSLWKIVRYFFILVVFRPFRKKTSTHSI
jgi:glycosyltransferase involved in cell wall biosynthesis